MENPRRKSSSNTTEFAGRKKEIRFKRLVPDAITPTKSHISSAGYDFYSLETAEINPWGKHCFDTGIAVRNIPHNSYLQLCSRSGLCLNNDINVAAGTIDSDYKSSIKVILFNLGGKPYQVEKGQKICQGIFLKTLGENVQPVKTLSEKTRGSNGFGSSDKNE